MDGRGFFDETMDLRKRLNCQPFDARFLYGAETNVLYLNFQRINVKSLERVDAMFTKIRPICETLGKRVHTVVNYEGIGWLATSKNGLPKQSVRPFSPDTSL